MTPDPCWTIRRAAAGPVDDGVLLLERHLGKFFPVLFARVFFRLLCRRFRFCFFILFGHNYNLPRFLDLYLARQPLVTLSSISRKISLLRFRLWR